MERVLFSLILLAYLVGILLSFAGTVRRSSRSLTGAAAVLALAWLLQLATIVRQGFVRGNLPLANTSEFLMVLAWLVLSLYLLVWARWKAHAAGLVLPPLAALMVAAAIGLVPMATRPITYGPEGLFVFHTTVSTLGMAALCVAFAMSLIYLVQDRALKTKSSFRMLQRLPSLQACDQIGHQALLWGLPLLTLGIVTGIAWNLSAHQRFVGGSIKETFPLLAWLVFAALLYARLVRGYRGRKSAYWTIAGFALVLLTILGLAR